MVCKRIGNPYNAIIMARKPRVDAGGMCYHVINRGNNRAEVFHKDQDYLRFTEMIGEATAPFVALGIGCP